MVINSILVIHDEALWFVDRLLAFVKFLIARAVKEKSRDN